MTSSKKEDWATLEVALEALQIIAGERQCADNLMGDKDVAREALELIRRSSPIAGYNVFNGGQGD